MTGAVQCQTAGLCTATQWAGPWHYVGVQMPGGVLAHGTVWRGSLLRFARANPNDGLCVGARARVGGLEAIVFVHHSAVHLRSVEPILGPHELLVRVPLAAESAMLSHVEIECLNQAPVLLTYPSSLWAPNGALRQVTPVPRTVVGRHRPVRADSRKRASVELKDWYTADFGRAIRVLVIHALPSDLAAGTAEFNALAGTPASRLLPRQRELFEDIVDPWYRQVSQVSGLRRTAERMLIDTKNTHTRARTHTGSPGIRMDAFAASRAGP